ncbi:hypothetical protein [Deinococcus navajonensis]|uniref:Uncharacterized protein n=1 Tax=Deinococcus navajonensis TaxID=309884 RepID=A0ABV8XJD3_9DEIO
MSDVFPPDLMPALLDQVQAWQGGAAPLDDLVQALTALGPEEGAVVQALIRAVHASLAPTPSHAVRPSADDWRAELMACRARVWPAPDPAGLLVGQDLLILTDGRQGTIVRRQGARPLPSSVAASLMLLCQTIIMAQHAVDAQELGQLQRQRLTSTSTSLSEIEPVD